ncbi:MAG: hypothetical protein ACRETH_11750, partial [Steroidobacteraceae bacterium]
MHLAPRAYVLVSVTAVLAVAGIWSADGSLSAVWHIPLGLLLLGVTLEGLYLRKVRIGAQLAAPQHAFLGRAQPAALVLANPAARPLAVEYAPAMPAGFEPLGAVRRVTAPAHGTVRDPLLLTPVRLGPQSWPALPARVRGPLGLAWWTRTLHPGEGIVVAPDTLRTRGKPRGLPGGARPRRIVGAG